MISLVFNLPYLSRSRNTDSEGSVARWFFWSRMVVLTISCHNKNPLLDVMSGFFFASDGIFAISTRDVSVYRLLS
jgi:hypothetical protein